MKTLYDPEKKQELLVRFEKLTSESKPLWGSMNAAQMLAHCTNGLQTPTGDMKMSPHPLRFIGRFFKKSFVHGDKPFKKNSPTAKELKISNPRDFTNEKERFLNAFHKLAAGEHAAVVTEHGFFGSMSPPEWGLLMYKHIDHHLQQFGL